MKLYKIQILIGCLFALSSCEKLVQTDPPEDLLVSSTIFESNETAISAATGVYATMMRNDFPLSYNIALHTGLYSDELEYKQSVPALLTLNNYALNAKDAPTNPFWTNGFNSIYQANALIEGLSQASVITQGIKNQLLGEAFFVRAFWNYYLSNLYGDIPLILSTDYAINAKLSKTNIDTVHTQIIKDLLLAKDFLNEKYVAGNTVSEAADRIRPNTFVASALLARIYLQMKNYSKAEEESTRIILNSRYDLADILQVFKRTSKEIIWQLELPTNTNFSNSYEARMFTLTAKPSVNSNQRCTTISQELISLFSEKDKRRTAWIGTYSDNTVTPSIKYNYPSKYKTLTTPANEYTTPFRLAEIYLIRAEARVQLGQITAAIDDTDKIRTRAGLDLLKDIPGIQKQSLLDSISNERRRELFCEWGLRWFDIKRSVNPNEIMTVIATQKDAIWKPSAVVWPIPLNDILNGSKYLEQNEGYN